MATMVTTEIAAPPKSRLSRQRIILIAVVVFLIAVGIGATLLVLNWPFTRQAVIDALQESSARSVTIDRFHMTFFPPGCVAEGISFLHRKHKDKPPLITVQKLDIVGSYSGLITTPKRLVKVRVTGLHVTVPPRNPDGTNPIMPLTDVNSRRPIVVGVVVADGAVLDFMSKPGKETKETFKLIINKLALHGVGNNKPIEYRATIQNTEPPGEIRSSGRFGPWMSDDPGRTLVSGNYTFEHADLGAFKDLSGVLSSAGNFSGTLDHIQASGHTEVGNFHLAHSGHTSKLTAEFRADVDATEGDVHLQNVQSQVNRTTMNSSGNIAGQAGEKGKTVALDVSSIGRVEDLLDLFIAAKTPPMTGNVSLKAKVVLPPTHEAFLEKLKVDGDFGLAAGKFTSHDTQGTLNKLSQSAGHGADKPEQPETALSNLKGHVSAKNGIATLTNISFSIPGANATVQGTFNLITQDVNLHGMLHTDGKIYVATQGVKSLLLRAITPFLKHKGHVTIVPFKVTGVYPNTTIALELFSKK